MHNCCCCRTYENTVLHSQVVVPNLMCACQRVKSDRRRHFSVVSVRLRQYRRRRGAEQSPRAPRPPRFARRPRGRASLARLPRRGCRLRGAAEAVWTVVSHESTKPRFRPANRRSPSSPFPPPPRSDAPLRARAEYAQRCAVAARRRGARFSRLSPTSA